MSGALRIIESDWELARKWFRCQRAGPCRQEGITTPAHEKIHVDGVAQMAREIAEAREAWYERVRPRFHLTPSPSAEAVHRAADHIG